MWRRPGSGTSDARPLGGRGGTDREGAVLDPRVPSVLGKPALAPAPAPRRLPLPATGRRR